MLPTTICFVAGHSGGHILPALTLAQNYKNQSNQNKILFFSTHSPLDNKIISGKKSIIDSYHKLSLENTPTKWYRLPLFALRFFFAWLKSLACLLYYRPTKIISTGGIISIPACFAGALLRIPITLYELNAVPGKATLFLAKYATTVACCFSEATDFFPKAKTKIVKYPLRFSTSYLPKKNNLPKNFSSSRKTLFIIGGSQGSLFINNAIKTMLAHNPDLRNTLQIIHQTGSYDSTDWKKFYMQYDIPALFFDYTDMLDAYYTHADLVICRSGAGTLFETLFFKKPCITIPLELATNTHQYENARAIARAHPHLFTIIRQQDILNNSNLLTQVIRQKLSL